jgi:hypothetical protein
MLLVLEHVDGLRPDDLLARPDKQGGAAVRGPLVNADGTPLSSLHGGDKLHIVGAGTEEVLSGHTPERLVDLLTRLGLSRSGRLKQIHLIADRTGAGEQRSYAAKLAAALDTAGFQVDELKAPFGNVRCDGRGKIAVQLPGAEDWQPSSSALNYYTGPHVQEKHSK